MSPSTLKNINPFSIMPCDYTICGFSARFFARKIQKPSNFAELCTQEASALLLLSSSIHVKGNCFLVLYLHVKRSLMKNNNLNRTALNSFLSRYTVEADGPIKDMTFISEYTGDVDFIKNREQDDCDSMMTLLLATEPSQSLVICADKRGNIARFINGINNHTL